MTTTRFDYTKPAPFTSHGQGGHGVVEAVRDPATLGNAPLGTVGPDANTQGGLGFEHLRHGVLALPTVEPTANYTGITSVDFDELDSTRLAGVLKCSGRPLRVTVSMVVEQNTATAYVLAAVQMDGATITGSRGLWQRDSAAGNGGITTVTTVRSPAKGDHRFAVVVAVNAGSGSVLATGGYMPELIIEEM